MSMITASLAPPQRILSQLNSDAADRLEAVLNRVQSAIAPVWPLQDFVAVNPFGGMAERPFHVVREELQSLSDSELLMPLAYYRQQWERGAFDRNHVAAAREELIADGVLPEGVLPLEEFEQQLRTAPASSTAPPQLRLASQILDEHEQTDWADVVLSELGKYCGTHYDQGQARWNSPKRDQPLYRAWRSLAQRDRRVEILGLKRFRPFVADLPFTPEAAIFYLLQQLQVPSALWHDYLLCAALSSPGWSAWTKYQTLESSKHGFENPDFAGLLAMRLAYEAAIASQFAVDVKGSLADFTAGVAQQDADPDEDVLLRLLLLRAQEIGFRDRMLMAIGHSDVPAAKRVQVPTRKTAQMVFCIDVRSERIRRNLESVSSEVETFGFAGFFGLPFEYVRLGDHDGTIQHPVLIDPSFQVHESIRGEAPQQITQQASRRRQFRRGWRYLWKSFQGSAVSGFAFVETAGLLYAAKLWQRMRGHSGPEYSLDGVRSSHHEHLGPSLHSLNRQGVTTSQQVDLAESILRGVGLLENFAPLVVFCGHHASTENNPLQAGLDCGACAGHSGEANARFAAQLINQRYVRQGLRQRGIEIPDDTHFLAGIHNTTSDEITFFDQDLVPASHRGYVAELRQHSVLAGQRTREERLPSLREEDAASVARRATDWSEVRPEWGLTGNAAFVIGRREWTRHTSLQGASFLHSYDARLDPEGQVLEQIMTAPLVVTNWINMQYYASTVDQRNYGSGSKTIHNVVGKFGIFSGGGGDLTTGLPWESIHNGKAYQHEPLRLLALIEASPAVVARILQDHKAIRDLVVNGWVHLVVADGDQFQRYTPAGAWQTLDSAQVRNPPACSLIAS